MALSPAERMQLGLDDPGEYAHAHEFGGPPEGTPAPGMPVPRPPTSLRLVLKDGEKATAPKIRTMVNELLAGNIDNANYWLQQVGAANPKVAVELFIELAQFSLPKLKAVAMQIDDRSENPRAVSFAELQKMLVSEQ